MPDDTWLTILDPLKWDPTWLQYEFKFGMGASPVDNGFTSDEGGRGHRMPYNSREV